LNRIPTSPVRINPEIPPKLEETINKALEKDRNLRYQHASEIRTDLARLKRDTQSAQTASTRIGADRTGIRSLAVLPLENRSGDPEQEYFADGMTDALITDLAKISALRVIARISAMRYKGTHKSLPQIAQELNVDGVVEGSVLRVGKRVRISVQL